MSHAIATQQQQKRVTPACLGLPLELFYGPAKGAELVTTERTRTAMVRALCASCPIRPACIEQELALPAHEQHGIRGGLTADERRALLRRTRRTTAPKRVAA